MEPSSRLIQRSYDLCGGSWSALSPEKTSRNSWYSSGISDDVSVGVCSGEVGSALFNRAVMVVSDDGSGRARNRALPFCRLSLVKSRAFTRRMSIMGFFSEGGVWSGV